MLTTFFISMIALAFFIGFKAKEFYLSDHERTQKLLLKLHHMPRHLINRTEAHILAKYSLHKALPKIVVRAQKGSSCDRWILYKAAQTHKLHFNDLIYDVERHPKLTYTSIDTYIHINGSNWPLKTWLDEMVKGGEWTPAIVEKGQLLLEDKTLQSNQKAVTLLETIERGIGGNFLVACPILAEIFKDGIEGVSPDPKKCAYYTQFL
jgi:hypothetical protein